jgi:hypothetical protein
MPAKKKEHLLLPESKRDEMLASSISLQKCLDIKCKKEQEKLKLNKYAIKQEKLMEKLKNDGKNIEEKYKKDKVKKGIEFNKKYSKYQKDFYNLEFKKLKDKENIKFIKCQIKNCYNESLIRFKFTIEALLFYSDKNSEIYKLASKYNNILKNNKYKLTVEDMNNFVIDRHKIDLKKSLNIQKTSTVNTALSVPSAKIIKNPANKKKTSTVNKNHKNYLLKGGWDKTDPDFINNDNYRRLNMSNLGNFERKILIDLLYNINKNFNKNFTNLDEARTFIKTLPPEELIDDFDYEFPKFSIIPKGTIFYRRQKENTFRSVNRPIWLDYTGTMSASPISFLKDTNTKYTQDILNETINHFGKFLMKFRVNEDLLILHFPSYVFSNLETWVNYMCVYTRDKNCVDGYTLDFLKFNTNPIYSNFESLDGYRELCILDAQKVSLIDII